MPATRLRIFISSVQKEFAQQRLDLKAFLLGDAVLRRFVSDVFLFEEIPARDQRADKVYLEELEQCDIYLGIFGNKYGFEDDDGISPTEREFDHASQLGKLRFIYVWGSSDEQRDAKMQSLIGRASRELVRRRIEDVSALTAEVYASLVDYLDGVGALRVPPFDTSACEQATLDHIYRKRIEWFLDTARRERGFPLKANTGTQALLTHLNLIDDDKPTNAAMLLFGDNPQRFHRTAETKCVHCHGTEYRRPFASMQVYGGDLFEQADQARDFVLAKINRAIGTRTSSITAPATYELPPGAVGEGIVNAIAHRDYNSNASVEVRLFADRLEIWNPGSLPGTLTLDGLRKDHPSVPYNPLIAESLYLARYIEHAGSGTQAMIELCQESGLPEPQFEQRAGFFVTIIWRDWLTVEVLAGYSLNDRQRKAIKYAKNTGRINNAQYRELTGVSDSTALRELRQLTMLGIFEKVGETGQSAFYTIVKSKPVMKAKDENPS